MSALLLAQWRLVRTSAIVFTALGVLLPPLADGLTIMNTVSPPRVSLFVTWLAASLAARLFAGDLVRHDTLWWRSLPLEREQWFKVKLGFGLAILAASFLVQWASWHSPLHGWLFEVTRREDYLLAVSQLRGADTLVLALLTFAVTAYFATSFERHASAVQAGLPGYLSALSLFNLVAGDEIVLHPLRAWTSTLLLALGGVLIARSLWRRRTSAPVESEERLLSSGTAFDRGVHCVGQAAFVAVPVVAVLADNSISSMFPSPLAACVGLLLFAGLLALPTSVHEARSAGITTARGVSVLALRTSGLGIPLWRALRGERATLRCADCRRVREAGRRACPKCASLAVATVPARGPWLRAPNTPWGVFLVALLPLFLAQNLVPMFLPTAREHWFVQADLPGVVLASESMGRSAELLELEQTVPREGGWWSIRSGRGTNRTDRVQLGNPLRTADLRAAMLGQRAEERGLLGWPGVDTFTAGDPSRGDWIESARLEYEHDRFALTSRTSLCVRVPRLEDEAFGILEHARAGTLSPVVLDRAANSEEGLVSLLLRFAARSPDSTLEAGAAASAPARARIGRVDAVERDAIDAVVRRRYGIAPGTYDREVAQRALGELEARRRFGVLSPPGQSDALATIESVYGPLRALALSASESELRVEIRNRNEFAAIAAGMRKEAALYEDCRRLFAVASAERASSAGERERVLQSTAAAWAMLCMDREQSAEIVLDAQLSQYLLGERALWLLLGHSECPRVTARLESVFGPGVSDLAQELRSVAYDVRLAVRGLAEGRRLEDFWFER